MITIRPMTINDYEQVHALWAATDGMGLNPVDDTRAGIEKYLRRNPTTCFVAVDENSIAGSILCGHDGRRGFIYHLAVAKPLQGRGIGRKLVDAAVNALHVEGIQKAALVVFRSNEGGNAFWEREGFTERSDLVYRNRVVE